MAENLKITLAIFAVILFVMPGFSDDPFFYTVPEEFWALGQRGTITSGVLVVSEITMEEANDIYSLTATLLYDLVTPPTDTLPNIIPKENISFDPDYPFTINDGTSRTMEIEVDIPPDILNETIYDGTITFTWRWFKDAVWHDEISSVPIHVYVRNPEAEIDPISVDLVANAGTSVDSSVTISNVEEDVPWALEIMDLNATASNLTSNGNVIPSSNIVLDIPADTTIEQGESRTIGITINVPADASLGIYTGVLTISTFAENFLVPINLTIRTPQVITVPPTIDLAINAGASRGTSILVFNSDTELDVLELAADSSDLTSNGNVIPSTDIDINVPPPGQIPIGGSLSIGLIFNVAGGTAPGIYTGELTLFTRDEPMFAVPINLHVVNFVNIPRPFEVVRIDIDSDKILDVSGGYSSSYSGAIFSGTISLNATQDEKGKVFADGSLVLDDQTSSFSLKGKLKMKAKTGELTIALKGKGIGQKYKLMAKGTVNDELALHFSYKGKGKGNKDEFDFSEPLVNPERGATVLFFELTGKGKKKVKNVKGSGELLLPYPQTRPEVKIKEKIKKETVRSYAIKGFKFQLKLNTEESDDELNVTSDPKCKVGYGKIPLTKDDIELEYLSLE